MTGIFSFEDEAPIKNWLFNSVENLKGSRIELPTNWMDISYLCKAEKCPLLSFYGKNREGKIKYTSRSFSILGTTRF